MSQFLRKTIVSRTSSLVSLRNPNSRSLRRFSGESLSFTASYLMNSLGFSEKSALSASKSLNLRTPEKPDKLISALKVHGFTQTQISTLVERFPGVLVSNTEKIILPKLEFLKSRGLSNPEMAKMLSSSPYLLRKSLKNQIVPTFDFLNNLFGSDETKTIKTVKRWAGILSNSKNLASNIKILQGHGVPESNIVSLVLNQPRASTMAPGRFSRVVDEVIAARFNPCLKIFVLAVQVSLGFSEALRARKARAYIKLGFSEEEVSRVFRSHPLFMAYSEAKVVAIAGFFVNEMSWGVSIAAKYPMVFGLSLKKRIVPRCLVYRALISRGFMKKKSKVNLKALLLSSEEMFVKKYIEPYEKEAPEISKLYEEKLVDGV